MLLGSVVVVGLAVWGLLALTRLPLFAITSVEVRGVEHLEPERVIALADVETGASLVWLRKGPLAERILRDPWVSEVRVDRDFPRTVRITVQERVPSVVVDLGGSTLWVVSEDGRWLAERSDEGTSVPVIRDAETEPPRAGARVRSAEVLNAIEVVGGLSDEMLGMVRVVSAPSIEKTALITNDDVQVFVGEATDIRKKDLIAREILRTQKGKVVYINVRVVDSPTWRGLDQ